MIILLIMCLGVALGAYIFPEKWQVHNSKVQVISIVILIFCMGVTLGSNETLMDKLLGMGLQGLLFAVIPIILSVIVVYILTRLFMKEKKDDQSNND
ncbi:LysO family transporter [Niameybacter massiliensis]|uniref:LysO family transporter n=1 Tax=Holtiella tumoricola TaxID=3018743 RepID=A0AA42DPK5_9FIRM|nr:MULTISPECIES: LysO family transporter [Lachnospirales]MDA3732929.1 LysO family transporter [Holtiella tumoricola]